MSTTTGLRFPDLLSTRIRDLPVVLGLLVVVPIPSGDSDSVKGRPFVDDTRSQRRRKSRHLEDSMMDERLGRIQWGTSQRLIRSYRSQDPFPHKPTITVFVIAFVTTFIIPSSSCFMITTYHAMSCKIVTYHNTITPYAQPMLYSFPCLYLYAFHFGLRGSPIQPL